jgi:L-alanine-DL-glutamate epimerase-like enolase superfamily enzyme
MKIKKIVPHFFEKPLINPVSDARNTIVKRACVLVSVETDKGITGWGEAASFAGCGSLVVNTLKFFEEFFIGKDPLMTSKLYDDAYQASLHFGRRGLVINALSGIDIALWDILGKTANLPLYKILGASRNSINYYLNGGYYVSDNNLDFLEKSVTTAIKHDARALKIKIGRFGLEDDAKRISIVRSLLGSDRDLMVDANGTMDIHYLKRLDPILIEHNVRWIEEPVSLRGINLLKRLSDQLKTPIAGYELEMTLQGYSELIENHVIDIVQPDTIWSGGVTECKRISAVAQSQEVELVPHNFASIIALAANAHIAASAKTGGWLEIDANENPFLWALDREKHYQMIEGKIKIPEKPGIGIIPDLTSIEEYRLL